jgi:hypothetical protein
MRQYKVYLPLNYNDGAPIARQKIDEVRDRLADRFGGATISPLSAPYKGPWKYGGVQYIDNIVIMEVIADEQAATQTFFRELKEQLQRDLDQHAILITSHSIEMINSGGT